MRVQRALILILVGWYLVLILGHYFNQRPLWNDELCVLNNILYQKPGALFTRPLLSDQAFPRLYLWLIQLVSKPFNESLLILRFFSLIAMIGAFFVWLKVAHRLWGPSWHLIFFIACWCGSMPLVYYAAELKPYSMDVLVSGLIVLFLMSPHLHEKSGVTYQGICLFLPLLGLWSYPAIFLLLLPLYNLIHDSLLKRRCQPELSSYVFAYLLMLVLVYFFDFRVSVNHLMEDFWHDYFISFSSLKDFFNTFGKGMNNLIARRFAEDPRWVKVPSRVFIASGVGYMCLVFGRQFIKDHFALRSCITISFALFLVQLVLAVLRVYPFAVPRMSLFYSPLLFIMTLMALSMISRLHRHLGILMRWILAGYLILVSGGIAWDVFLRGNLGAESCLYSRS